MKLDKIQVLRKLLIPLFSKVNLGDIRISHHYTGDKILIHSFKHKGYWYHGKNREYETMVAFKKILKPGDTVIEIGGHIGYISLWFSYLVGPKGSVHVFEPGENNLPYIRYNISNKTNITLIEKGAGSKNETLIFYLDNLTGQNNSFLGEHDAFKETKKNAYIKNTELQKVEVDVIRVDDYVMQKNIKPRLIKIDVEGYECEVLIGLIETLKIYKPILMVEIAQDNRDWVYKTMDKLGYVGYTPTLKKETRDQIGNVFFMHSR